MKVAFIDPEKCIKCKKCAAAGVCPLKIIFQIDTDEPAVIDSGSCHGCGDCIPKCPAKAIVLKDA